MTASSWPVFAEDEVAAATSVLQSGRVNYWTGEEGRLFEREAAEAFGAPYCIAVANGTVALDLSLVALDIGPGDEVIVTPRTFLASASSIVLQGATPVFADVDPVSQNITPKTVRAVITEKTRAIIAVHLAGWPCDMDGLRALAQEHDLKIIEDCAQAHGATYKGKPVGSFGDAAAFSFCQDKIMTTGGEGGLVLFQDEEAWRRAWSYKDHGKDWDAVYNREHPPGFRWLHESFGTNWRLTEMQAAIGRIQLRKLPDWVARRQENAAVFQKTFADQSAVRVTTPPADISHAYYKYYAFVRPERLKADWTRDRIVAEIQAQDVPCMQGSCSEIYLEKAFDGTGFRPAKRLPVAKELGETSLMFLVHPTLEPQQMERAAEVACKVLEEASL